MIYSDGFLDDGLFEDVLFVPVAQGEGYLEWLAKSVRVLILFFFFF